MGRSSKKYWGDKFITRQFNVVRLFQLVAIIAFVLGSRSCWLTFKNPSIPSLATILLGIAIAILAERTRLHFAIVSLIILTVSVLQMGFYCWESMLNSEARDFPHIVTYHYSGELDLNILVGGIASLATVGLGCAIAAGIRYSRNTTNNPMDRSGGSTAS